ncbi:hypothetical protein Hdeb2414_s0868g00955851 [Helianthus debilis subsp. tardiflorus]
MKGAIAGFSCPVNNHWSLQMLLPFLFKRQQRKGLLVSLLTFLWVGFAVSKTAAAPIERVKLLI